MLRSISARLLALLLFVGCDAAPRLSLEREPVAPPSAPRASSIPVDEGSAAAGTIRIASYNIQVFGTSKIGKPHVMDILADVARRFDIIAIQEIRSIDQTVLPRFVDLINAGGASYAYLIGPRLGRTSSKEQYAFVYNSDRIELGQAPAYTVNDPEDLLHREPIVASFRVRGPSPERAFTFQLANIHTDPDETDTELDALAEVFVAVQRVGGRRRDPVGRLECGRVQLGAAWSTPGHCLRDFRHNHEYPADQDVRQPGIRRQVHRRVHGKSRSLGFDRRIWPDRMQALEVSDHFPVWAEFSALETEVGDLVAERPSAGVR